MNDLSPRDMLERALRLWWFIAAGIILGGSLGWIFTRFHRPVYTAIAIYRVQLDQQMIADRNHIPANDLPLDFPAQDVYLAPAASVFDLSAAMVAPGRPNTRTQLIAAAKAEGIELTEADITSTNFNVDRRGIDWLVIVQSTDPARAAKLANLWVNAADANLRQAQTHYAHFLDLQTQRDAIQKCFAGLDFTQANACAGTNFASRAELESYQSNLQQQIQSEQVAGESIDPALSFSFMQPAQPPSSAFLYRTTLVILAGGLIGFLLGLSGSQVLPVRR